MLTQVRVKLHNKNKKDDKSTQKKRMITYKGMRIILTVHFYGSQK